MSGDAILVAATSAMFDQDGRRVVIKQGRTTVREGHPITRGREHLFKPFKVDFETEAAQETPKGQAPKVQQPARPKSGQQTA
jgi:hypothetical protein